jgi:signal transduction histidine kinase/CheY-like chemotaxis protein
MVEADKTIDERILILVPTTKDAVATQRILQTAGLISHVCESMLQIAREGGRGAGAALLTEESIANDREGYLSSFLRAQPKWSDFPLVVLTRAGLDPRTSFADLRAVGRMTLVQRPVQIAGLVSTLEAAIRDRRRQYKLRDYLIERDITEEQLRDADRRKDEFLAMLAHELRNPLAAVNTATAVLRQDRLNSDERRQMFEILSRQVAQLNRLIDDLLDVSRITRGKIELKRVPLKVSQLVDAAVQVVRPLVTAAGHHLEVDRPIEDDLWILADPARMEQVVVNLLTNSTKYTPPGGQIELQFKREGDQLCLAVRDNGLGISSDMLNRIFEVFTQVRHTLDRSEGGLGIGLTVVRRLVEMHGGRVEAHSDGVGHGSEFVVCLPLIDPPPEAQQRADAPHEEHTSKRVLIVDDNRDSAASLQILLRTAGYKTAVVHDGLSAVDAAEEFQPAIALLDIGLPGIDGYELATRLQQKDELKNTLLVAVSGYGQPEDRRRSKEAGFHYHLVKPVDPQQLLQLIAAEG